MDFFTPPEARADYQQPTPVRALAMLTADDRQQQGEEVRARARAVLDEDARELQLKKLQKATETRRAALAAVDEQLQLMKKKLQLAPKNQIFRSQIKGLIQKRITLSTCIARQEQMYSKIEMVHQRAESGKLLTESQGLLRGANSYLRSVNANLSVDDIEETYDEMQMQLEAQDELQLAASRPVQTNSKDQLTDDQMEEALNRFLAEDDDEDELLAAGAEELPIVIEMPSSRPNAATASPSPNRSIPQSVSMTRRLRAEDPLLA